MSVIREYTKEVYEKSYSVWVGECVILATKHYKSEKIDKVSISGGTDPAGMRTPAMLRLEEIDEFIDALRAMRDKLLPAPPVV